MNKVRRDKLADILGRIQVIKEELEEVTGEEETYMYNIPENLQGGEKYERTEEICDNLNEAIETLDSAIESIEAVLE